MRYAPKSEIVTAYQFDGTYKSLKDILSLFPSYYSLQVEGLQDNGFMDSWVIRSPQNQTHTFPTGTWIVKQDEPTHLQIIQDDIFKERYTAL